MSCTVNTLAVLVGLAYACFLCQGQGFDDVCGQVEKAYFFEQTYSLPNYRVSKQAYSGRSAQCTVKFHTSHSNAGIKVTGIDVNLVNGGWCDEEIISIYDGESRHSPKLFDSCRDSGLDVTSSGHDLLLVYKFNSNSNGFKIRYVVVDNDDDSGYESDFDYSLSSGAIFGICIAPIISVIFVICIIVYSCKSYKKLKEDLAARGYTRHDLQLTRMTMLYKARNGQLTITTTTSRGQVVSRQARVLDVQRAMRVWSQRGMSADPNEPLQVVFQEHMDQFALQRQRNEPQNTSRVRHPAGDIRASQDPLVEQYPLNPTSIVPSVDVSHDDRQHPPNNHYHSSPYTNITGSNNNLSTNNNSTHNLNYLNGQNFPSNPSPSNSLDRRSPRHHHQDQGSMSNMLTYYGGVDGDGASASPSTPSAPPQEQYEAPPPSYDEVTAGGRLSPYNKY